MSQLREWSHAAVAVLGVLAGSTALIVTLVGLFGVHISEADVLQKIGLVGAVITLLSKVVDSANDAIVGGRAVSPATSSPVVPPVA